MMKRFESIGISMLAVAATVTLANCSGTREACAPGDADCACLAGSRCADGLVCTDGNVCERPRTEGLPAIDPAARSCEVLLEESGAQVSGVRFGGSVVGEFVRQAPKTALAFHARGDTAMAGLDVGVEVAGDGAFTIASAHCFDRQGRVVDSPLAAR